ncbi:hypothetical protein [Priestia megaterium]|uniref:hypothetical protein n=1 Tax=Priestia megaterium TaxID=1404 RepID=UPI002E1DB967
MNNRKGCQNCNNIVNQNQENETTNINNQVVSNISPNINLNILLALLILPFILPPPPSFTPPFPSFVDPGAISLCLFRNTYIWLRNGTSFWYFPIFVGPRSVAGFRWTGRFWVIYGIDTRQIVSFTCF